MKTSSLFTLPLIGFVFFAQASFAQPSSMMGGKSMTTNTGHQLGLGWPSLSYKWWHSGNPDWTIGGELVYGDWSGEFSNLEIGVAVNASFGWRMYKQGITEVAFRLSPGGLIGSAGGGPNDHFAFGARMELEVPISIDLHPKVSLITGGNLPVTLYFIEDQDDFVVLPILGRIGAEVEATTSIHPFILLELGPAIALGDFGSEIEFAFRAWFGSMFW